MNVAKMADVLDQAAQVIETNGWLQEDFYDYDQRNAGTQPKDCRVCAYGAISIVVTGTPVPPNDSELGADISDIAVAVEEATGIEGYDLAAWNDMRDRTAEQVTGAFRTTAAKLRKQVTPHAAENTCEHCARPAPEGKTYCSHAHRLADKDHGPDHDTDGGES